MPEQAKVKTTVVYEYLQQSDKRITVMQGGTRSSKTYNILIWFIVKLMNETGKTLTICRQTTPSLKATVMRDFFEILNNYGLYEDSNWHATDKIYKLNGNIIEFRNLDDDQKIRGAKRDYLFVNEANEISLPVFKQLLFRTSGKIIIDYNPSDEFHWIYDFVIPRDDADFYKTTYLDNPFLPKELVSEIERLKEVDPNYWRIYGLGERGVSEATIFRNWSYWGKDKEPEGDTYYGLDFGYNHPMSLVKSVFIDEGIYSKQLIYKSHLTIPQLIDEMKLLGIGPNDSIYADCSRPEAIKEIKRAGFNIHPTIKGKNSVIDGIEYIKRHRVFIDKESVDFVKELKSYKWKVDKDGRILDEPVKINDDIVDGFRYSCNFMIKPTGRQVSLNDPDNITGLF